MGSIEGFMVGKTRSLNIAVLSAHSCPLGKPGTRDTGGMNIYLRGLARALAEQGHRLDLFTRRHGSAHDKVMELSGGRCRVVHLAIGADQVNSKAELHSYMSLFARQAELFGACHGQVYDLIFSNYWLSGVAGNLLRKHWQVPHVLMFHTLGAIKKATFYGQDEPHLRLASESSLARECDHIIAATRYEQKILEKHFNVSPDRISVIPCGVDLELFRPLDKAEARSKIGFRGEKMILFVGRIEPIKGIERLIKAISRISPERRPILYIIGGGESSEAEIKRLKSLARALQVEQRLVFTGALDHEVLPVYYSAADACIVSSYYESFGLVALEALACGTPVVCTDVGALRQVIKTGQNGRLINESTPGSEGLAAGITDVLEHLAWDPSKIRSSVTPYGWPEIAGQVNRLFYSLVNGSQT